MSGNNKTLLYGLWQTILHIWILHFCTQAIKLTIKAPNGILNTKEYIKTSYLLKEPS